MPGPRRAWRPGRHAAPGGPLQLGRVLLAHAARCSWRHGPDGEEGRPEPKFTETERLNAQLLERNAELERRLHIVNVLIAPLNSADPHTYATPKLTATAPRQVWTWDIAKLATLQKGVFLHAYVIIDLFSRYVVGWMVAVKEDREVPTRSSRSVRIGPKDRCLTRVDRFHAVERRLRA